MRCPIDDLSLVTTERGGIEIDYCPQCRGVWLDRGELDKLLAQDVATDVLHRESDFESTVTPGHTLGHERKGFLRELFGF